MKRLLSIVMLLLSVVGIYADNPVTVKAGNPVVLICYEEVLKGAFRQCIYCSILLLNPTLLSRLEIIGPEKARI